MARIVKLECKLCGNPFEVNLGKEKIFCSKECQKKDRFENNKKFYIEKNCECCGMPFISKKKENKKFCSYKCSGLQKNKNAVEKKTCLECGNIFIERKKRKKNFCTSECLIKWQSNPVNIKKRIDKSKEAVQKKYGVDYTFQIKEKRLLASKKSKAAYHERGSDIVKPALQKLAKNREKKLTSRFSKLGYDILEFDGKNLKVSHPDGHIFNENRKLLVNRLNHGVELSTIIQPLGSPRTTFERKICNFLTTNNINYIPNDRKTISGELDINIPSHSTAIEINGLYWHSEYYLNKSYHIDKTNKCLEKNIQLFHFFEDELLEKYDIIESMISNKLGLINNKIYARKCEIKEVDPKTSSKFLNENHIQGNVNSLIKIGLYYNDELVALMTFGKLRNVLGNKNKNIGEFELLRFCNKINTIVIGGASKLLKHFNLKHQPNKIITFANKRYSNGNLYGVLGFVLDKTTQPNYWYVVGKKRKHRFSFRKDILVKEGYDPNKTEHQIMQERKIPRIYDCGNIKYIKI